MKLRFIIIILIAAGLFTGCSENVPQASPETTQNLETSPFLITGEEPEIITSPPVVTNQPLPEPEEDKEPAYTPPTPEEFVLLDSGWFHGGTLPQFNHISEIPLLTLLNFGSWKMELPHEWIDNEDSRREAIFGDDYFMLGNSVFAFKPNEVDEYFKQALNPDFSIESYDYKSLDDFSIEIGFKAAWNEQEQAIIMFTGVFGGGSVYYNEILNTYEDENYYVENRGFWCHVDYCFQEHDDFDNLICVTNPLEYSLYTFKQNDNGIYNLLSKQPYKGEA